MQIFLSYRRSDSGGHAGRLYDALVARLGSSAVFQDIPAIMPGEDFANAIDRELARSDVVLAVIGPGWERAADPEGMPRLHDPDDYVRFELGRALQQGRPVVPVLVGGASLPAAASLPEELGALPRRQAVVLRDESWPQDVDSLVRVLRGERSSEPRRRSRPAVRAAAALTIAAVGVLSFLALRARSPDGEVAAPPPACPTPTAEWTELALADDPTVSIDDEGPLTFEVTGAFSRPEGPGAWTVLLRTDFGNRTTEHRYHGDWYYGLLVVAQRPFEDVSCMSPDPELVPPGTIGQGLVGFPVSCEPVGRIELRITFTSDELGDQERAITVTRDRVPGDC